MVSLLAFGLFPSLAFAAVSAAAPGETPLQAQNREFMAKNYPPGALKRGEQGRVAFRLTIEPDGSLGSCEVTESSGFAGLDNETCEIMVFNARLKPVVNEDGRAIRATQNGFIVWRLPGAANAVAESAATTMPKPDEIICKKQAKTGSLVSQTKQCMTKSEWARTEKIWRDEIDRVRGGGCDGRGGPCPAELYGNRSMDQLTGGTPQ